MSHRERRSWIGKIINATKFFIPNTTHAIITNPDHDNDIKLPINPNYEFALGLLFITLGAELIKSEQYMVGAPIFIFGVSYMYDAPLSSFIVNQKKVNSDSDQT